MSALDELVNEKSWRFDEGFNNQNGICNPEWTYEGEFPDPLAARRELAAYKKVVEAARWANGWLIRNAAEYMPLNTAIEELDKVTK